MCKITEANTHFVHHLKTKTRPARLTQSIVRRCTICSYFLPFLFLSFFFPLMNSSSVRANNRDSSNERAHNSAAILTGIKRSGGWWHSWWDTESGRKVKTGKEKREGDREGDAGLPSNCKANSKRSFKVSQETKQESAGMKWMKQVNTHLPENWNWIKYVWAWLTDLCI